MKLVYKHQRFQQEAVESVVSLFEGQGYGQSELSASDYGSGGELNLGRYGNSPIALSDGELLQSLRAVQTSQRLTPSKSLARDREASTGSAGYPIYSVEMETGTGKTYTYIRTMYELHKRYGWSKFIIVVPSIAIREGVLQSLKSMKDHFAQEYDGERIREFVYDSSRLTDLRAYAETSGLQVMVINKQAFTGGNTLSRRLITTATESFGYEKPIERLAELRPILIIDEPQSVLGAEGKGGKKGSESKTRIALREFNPLFALLYSATYRPEDRYNQVFRLDALDAYQQQLVKKIAVSTVEKEGAQGWQGYLRLDGIVLASRPGIAPRARMTYERKGKKGIERVTKVLRDRDNLYELSGELSAYRDGFRISEIDGYRGVVTLSSGIELVAGQTLGEQDEQVLRRWQIRETIRQHLERERQLHSRGIKVLSLFFIDQVERYRIYGSGGETELGQWAQLFEEEYMSVLNERTDLFTEPRLAEYLRSIDVRSTHAGYFYRDRRGKYVDSPEKGMKRDQADSNTFDLIMRDKERLLSMDEPVRFIFSHSALKEGWDNPNVFQICTLKDSSSDIKRRQEIGRGMRLCVNQQGQRQDATVLGAEVHDVNVLTVIASESYSEFSAGLQREIAESISDRPRVVDEKFLISKHLYHEDGTEIVTRSEEASDIYQRLVLSHYIDKEKHLTPLYYEHRDAGTLELDNWQPYQTSLVALLDEVFDPNRLKPEDSSKRRIAHFVESRFRSPGFQALWKQLRHKTYYQVNFSEDELIERAVERLNSDLYLSEVRVVVTRGELSTETPADDLFEGMAMQPAVKEQHQVREHLPQSLKYDLVGELVQRTGVGRRTLVSILRAMKPERFALYRTNPENFIQLASHLINQEKNMIAMGDLRYELLDDCYEMEVFTERLPEGITGKGGNALVSQRSLYDLVVTDSSVEMKFAEDLESLPDEVETYVKLPKRFVIPTPVGNYSPDWAIVMRQGTERHIYFVIETKGSSDRKDLRGVEDSKINSAHRHFACLADKLRGEGIRYRTLRSYDELRALLDSLRPAPEFVEDVRSSTANLTGSAETAHSIDLAHDH